MVARRSRNEHDLAARVVFVGDRVTLRVPVSCRLAPPAGRPGRLDHRLEVRTLDLRTLRIRVRDSFWVHRLTSLLRIRPGIPRSCCPDGEKYAQAIDVTGYEYGTLQNFGWVAGRIETSRRRDVLSWSHHAEVAALEPSEQDCLIRGALVRIGAVARAPAAR